MKNLLIALGLLSTNLVFAATTGNVALSGTIPSVLELSVSASGSGSGMDLTASQADLVVASITETSNLSAGYEVLVSTTNGGSLNHSGGDSLAYTAKYAGNSVTLSTSDQVAKTYATGGVNSDVEDFAISYTGASASSLEEGSYTDTVTFTIQSL